MFALSPTTSRRSRRRALSWWLVLPLLAMRLANGEDFAAPVSVDPELRVASIRGREIQPFKCEDSSMRAAVVLFITTDCPIANRYAPEIEKIRAEYEDSGVKMTLVHADPSLSVEDAARHAEEYALKAPIVIDRTHQLAAATGARVTPEAFVIDRSGRIRYRGRIDDQFAGYGERRAQAQSHDLREALTAVLEGREVKCPVTVAIGCLIPELP